MRGTRQESEREIGLKSLVVPISTTIPAMSTNRQNSDYATHELN